MTAAMIALKEAVERGRDESEKWRPAFGDYGYTAMQAFNGSLDAAVSLLGAVLPDTIWTIWRMEDGSYACNLPNQETEFSTTPARALLLAILSALIDALHTDASRAAAEKDGAA